MRERFAAIADQPLQGLVNGNIVNLTNVERGVSEARTAQNPKTLEKIQVPAKRTVKFKMGRIMKKKVNSKSVDI